MFNHIITREDFKTNNNNIVRSCIASNSVNKRNLWVVTNILTLKTHFELYGYGPLPCKDIPNLETAIAYYNK